jgi:hypothetical protein
MDLRKEAGRDCPSPPGHGAAQQSGFADGHPARWPPACKARADLDGETAVARWAHQLASPTHTLSLPRFSASEARSAAGAKASAIGARMGRDAWRLDAQHKSAVRHRRRRTESLNRRTSFSETRRRVKSAVRLYDDPSKHKAAKSSLRRPRETPATSSSTPHTTPATAERDARSMPNATRRPAEAGRRGGNQSPLLRVQIRLCVPSSPSTKRA